jgi:glutathione peroxidase-family protein
MFSKIAVTGPAAHPLCKELVAQQPTATGTTRAGFRRKNP